MNTINYALTGKTALVTGGSHGIGLATAKLLHEQGCKVAICARGQEQMNAFTSGRDWTMGLTFDALDLTSIAPVVKTVKEVYGAIDILVNNVGGGGRWGDRPENTDIIVYQEVMTKNAFAAAEFTRHVIPHMSERYWGRVVTVGSMYGKEAGGAPWFVMAKAAEIALMKSLSLYGYLSEDITFNTVVPGHIDIPGTGSDIDKAIYPIMGTPEDVAAVIAFLCTDEAKHVNGACITVDGGESRSF